jgi:hypothetical protein
MISAHENHEKDHENLYIYFCESILQDKSTHVVFTFSNSTT